MRTEERIEELLAKCVLDPETLAIDVSALSEEELEELQPYDPEESKRLIQAAGYDLPFKIKVMYPTGVDIYFHAEHLPIWRQQMQAAGFELDEEALDFGSWLGRYTVVDYDSSLALNQSVFI